jgi:hypothetical protein
MGRVGVVFCPPVNGQDAVFIFIEQPDRDKYLHKFVGIILPVGIKGYVLGVHAVQNAFRPRLGNHEHQVNERENSFCPKPELQLFPLPVVAE